MSYNRHFGYKYSHFGEDTKGHDVKGFGDTTGKYFLWDASADTFYIVGTTTLTGALGVTGAVTVTATTGAQLTLKYDAAAYMTITQADAAGVTFDSVSDGTAGFAFSDTVTLSPAGNTNCLILGGYGRISTSTAAGATLDWDATYTRTEGIELRYRVTDWTGVGNNCISSVYSRIESNSANASGSMRGLQQVTYSNGVGIGQIEGAYFETGVKAIAGDTTVGPIYGMESQISLYPPDSGTLTMTTECAAGRFQLGINSGLDDYTKLHGILIQTNDGSVASRTLGSAIMIRNYPVEGTQTWTKGLDIQAACTNDISLQNGETISNAANGIIAFSGVIQQGATATAALSIGGGTSATPLTTDTADKNFIGFWTQSTATSGDSRGMYLRHYLGGTIAATGFGDAIRAFCTVTGTGYSYASGLHGTMQINDGATVTGSGAGGRFTLAAASPAAPRTLEGALAALQLDGDIATDNTVPTRCSMIRLAKSGNVDIPYFLDIADDQILKGDATVGAANNAIKIIMPDGSAGYILVSPSA